MVKSNSDRQAWLVGGGIASLAAAVLLIRDGGFSGSQIHVMDAEDILGGSLDGAGSFEAGYMIRGGRMFEPHFACTFDLFDSIPVLDASQRTVTQVIRDFNRKIIPSSNCRLVKGGRRQESPSLKLDFTEKLLLTGLFLTPERLLLGKTIEDFFNPAFFQTPFWVMWSTMFAFRKWHSLAEFRRYMRRFIHLLPGFNRLEGIMRTPLNQYESLIVPLESWLRGQGVEIRTNCEVNALKFMGSADTLSVSEIRIQCNQSDVVIKVSRDDIVMVTLGSMTAGSSLGTHESPAQGREHAATASWRLWHDIAQVSDQFGRPDIFSGTINKTSWTSFTVTVEGSAFFDFMNDFTGNTHGTGGLVTLVDSNWQMSIVLAFQPHFANQPENVDVFWGYSLHSEKIGNCIKKPMSECSGQEILTELLHHLGQSEQYECFFGQARAIPCQMPYITSQFMPRSSGDRPAVVPRGTTNLAFLGQFCELPHDCVFTVEYSIRTAQTAVYHFVSSRKEALPIFRGDRNPAILWRAARALMN